MRTSARVCFCLLMVLVDCSRPARLSREAARAEDLAYADLGPAALDGGASLAAGVPNYRRLAPLRTLWPNVPSCRRFTSLYLATGPLAGIEWRGAKVSRRYLYTQRPPRKPAETNEDAQNAVGPFISPELESVRRQSHDPAPDEKFSLAEDKDFPASSLQEVIPLHAPGKPVSADEKIFPFSIEVSCEERDSLFVRFNCQPGSCTTTLARHFPAPEPVGGRYLGAHGWSCAAGCPRNNNLTPLLLANADQLAGNRRPALKRLALDLLSELPVVIQTACAGACTQPPMQAAAAALHLLARPQWNFAGLKPLSREDRREGDRVRGFIASFSLWSLTWKVKCMRVTDHLGMGLISQSETCTGSLYDHNELLAEYFPRTAPPDESDNYRTPNRFTQEVTFSDGNLRVITGTSFSNGRIFFCLPRCRTGVEQGRTELNGVIQLSTTH